MKRWFSRDSVRAKFGMAAIVLFAVLAIGWSSKQAVQHDAQLAHDAGSVQQNAAPGTVDISEKQKISVTKTEVVTTEEEVPFATTETYDGTLPKDTSVVRIEGHNGKKVVRTEVKTKDGQEISRALISEKITVPPVAKVIAIGTKILPKAADTSADACDTNYTPCVKQTGRDLDCKDVGHQVKVAAGGEDSHGLDPDNDGIGCENYPEP